MCLYPKLIPNRKYIANKKNQGIVPEAKDPRVLKVPVGCGKCMECTKQRAREWKVRLAEDIRHNKNAKFVTLTFSNEKYAELADEFPELKGYALDNAIAIYAVRHFLENWRSKTGKSVRHWLVTELGHNGTENVHLHGLLWTDDVAGIKNTWSYGYVFTGRYVSDKTINYIAKYVTKADKKHMEYSPKILTSAGIGSGYTQRPDSRLNKFKQQGETKETYTTRTGQQIAMPIYYRNKIYTEAEREALWLQKLDKQERWVGGIKVDVSTQKGQEEYWRLIQYVRTKNKRLGYGDDEKNWERKQYEEGIRQLKQRERIEKGREGIKRKKEEKRNTEPIELEPIKLANRDWGKLRSEWAAMERNWD